MEGDIVYLKHLTGMTVFSFNFHAQVDRGVVQFSDISLNLTLSEMQEESRQIIVFEGAAYRKMALSHLFVD